MIYSVFRQEATKIARNCEFEGTEVESCASYSQVVVNLDSRKGRFYEQVKRFHFSRIARCNSHYRGFDGDIDAHP